jgi:hypothetical protein
MLSVNVAVVDQSELPFPAQLEQEESELVVELGEECELPLPVPLPGEGWLIIS